MCYAQTLLHTESVFSHLHLRLLHVLAHQIGSHILVGSCFFYQILQVCQSVLDSSLVVCRT